MRPQQLIHQIAQEKGLSCCADGACVYGHPGGMQTNGGCAAYKETTPVVLRRHLTALRSIAIALADTVIGYRAGSRTLTPNWQSLKDAPPTNDVGRVILLRGPLLEKRDYVHDFCNGPHMYRLYKCYGKWTDKTTTMRDPQWTEWLEVPE